MKYDLFFKYAKEIGIEECELYISQSQNQSISLFHGEIENNEMSNSFNIIARGSYKGKFGTASCDVYNKDKAHYLANEILANARVIENDDPVFLFKGSEKYHKINFFNKDLQNIPLETKIQKLKELEKAIFAYDKRISEVDSVDYVEKSSSFTLLNSHGLKLSQKNNYYLFVGSAIAKENGQTKSGYDIFLDNNFGKFEVNKLATKIGKETVEQLGGEPCESKNYKAVLSNGVIASLIRYYISHASAEEVQKKSSLFIDKVNEKVASNKVTIEEKPLERNVFARYFDDEGVATRNKSIIKNGVLQGFLYNLTTAAKDNVTTTGNGYLGGGKMVVDTSFIVMRPGKKTLEQLFEEVHDGVYITEVSGLHSGLNEQSGNFSLQSTGFLIKNGKKDRALDIITVSGNLMDIFKNVITVGGDSHTFTNAISCPSVVIKKLAISGK